VLTFSGSSPPPLPPIASFAAALPVHRARPPPSALAALLALNVLLGLQKNCVSLFGLKFVNLKTCMNGTVLFIYSPVYLNSADSLVKYVLFYLEWLQQ